jgi:ABC-type cobalamin transport system permease subunit
MLLILPHVLDDVGVARQHVLWPEAALCGLGARMSKSDPF